MSAGAHRHYEQRQVRIKQQPPATFYNDPKSRTFRVAIDVNVNPRFRDAPPGAGVRLGVSFVLTYADGSPVADQGALLCRAATAPPPRGGDSDGPSVGIGDALSLALTADATSQWGEMCLQRPQHQRGDETEPDWRPVEFKFYLAHVSSRAEHGNRAFKLRFAAFVAGTNDGDAASWAGPGGGGCTHTPDSAPVCTSPILVLAKDPLKRKRGPKYHKHRACRAALRAAKRAAKAANAAARKALRCARAAKVGENRLRAQLQPALQLQHGQRRTAAAPPAHEPAPKRRQVQLHSSPELPLSVPLAPTLSPVLIAAPRYAHLPGAEAAAVSPLWLPVAFTPKSPAACGAAEWQSLALALGDPSPGRPLNANAGSQAAGIAAAQSEQSEPCTSEQSEQSEPEPDAIDMDVDICIESFELLDGMDGLFDLEPDFLGL